MRRQRNLLGPQGMGGMVSLWGASSLIRSVQYGSGTCNSAATNFTITAVNTANTAVVSLLTKSNYGGISYGVAARTVELTSSTNVLVEAQNFVSETINFVVVEFAPGVLKSVQQGTTTLSTSLSTTATITSVDIAKSVLLVSQKTNGDLSSANAWEFATSTLTNATTVTSSRHNTSATYFTYTDFFVVEFY